MTNCNDNTIEVVKLLNSTTNYQDEPLIGQGLKLLRGSCEQLVGKAAFTKFLQIVLDGRYLSSDRLTNAHLWLIVQGKTPTFYRGGVSTEPKGYVTCLRDSKKPESRETVGGVIDLYDKVAEHCKKPDSNGVTCIPSLPAWLPIKSRFEASNIIPVEFDQIGIDEQWQLADYLASYGLVPVAIVHSASKSLHFYFMLDRELGEEQLTFIKNLFVPFGADPKPCQNVVNSFRISGFPRATKGQEQTLEFYVEDPADVVLSPDEFTNKLQVALKAKGLEAKAELTTKKNQRIDHEAADLGIFDGNDLRKLINEILATLPPRIPGNGTYESYRQLAKAIANLVGEEAAIALMENHSPQEPNWRQKIASTTGQFRFKAIVEAMRVLVDPDWTLPVWFSEKYGQQSEVKDDDYSSKCWQSWEETKKLTSDIVINKEQFEYDVLQTSNTIEFVKSGLGSGKTTNLRKVLVEYCKKRGVVNLGYRNLLLFQFGAHEDFKGNQLGFYHINKDSKDIFFADPNLWLSACVDSLLKIPLDIFEGKIIIFDEINSIIKHLLFSSTVKQRPKVIQHFFEAIRRCDRVLAMDGHLADWAVDFFKGINSGKNIVTIENQFKSVKAPLTILTGTITDDDILKANDRSPLIKQILAEDETFAICSDSQIFLESIDGLLTAKGKKTLRIDAKTAKDVIGIIEAGINDHLKTHPDTILLYSPSAESGLDIDIKGYFKKQFCLLFGVLDVDSSIQLVNRVRDINCHKYLWARQFAPSDDPCDARSYIAETLAWYENQALSRDLHSVMSGEAGGLEAIANILKMVQDSHGTDSKTANRLQAIRNFERANFRECLKKSLTMSGYEFDEVCFAHNDPQDFAAKEELKAATNEVKDQNAQDIFNASDRFVGKPDKSTLDADWPTRCEIEKARLLDRLPGIELTDFWDSGLIRRLRYDEPQLIANLERYYLSQNLDIAKVLSIDKYEKLNQTAIAGETISLWHHRTDYSMVKALNDIGLFDLVGSGESYTADSLAIKAIIKKCKTKPIQHSLKRSPGKDSMKFIGRLLRLIGLEWRRKTVKLADGTRENRYTVINPIPTDASLTALLTCIDTRFNRKVYQYKAKKEANFCSETSHPKYGSDDAPLTPIQQGLKVVTLSTDFNINKMSEVLPQNPSTPFKAGDRVICRGDQWVMEVVAVHNMDAILKFIGIDDPEAVIEMGVNHLIRYEEGAHHA